MDITIGRNMINYCWDFGYPSVPCLRTLFYNNAAKGELPVPSSKLNTIEFHPVSKMIDRFSSCWCCHRQVAVTDQCVVLDNNAKGRFRRATFGCTKIKCCLREWTEPSSGYTDWRRTSGPWGYNRCSPQNLGPSSYQCPVTDHH